MYGIFLNLMALTLR